MTLFLIKKNMKITFFINFCLLTTIFGLTFNSFKMENYFDDHQDRELNHQRNFIKQLKMNKENKQNLSSKSKFLKVSEFISESNYSILSILSILITAKKTKISTRIIGS